MDGDEALATLAARYLAGYGPATAGDLARWSGPAARHGPPRAGRRRRAAARLRPSAGARAAQLLGGFDPVMLGYQSREPVLAAEHDRRILPGGGILKAVVLSRGRRWAPGGWGGGPRRRLEVDWFGRSPRGRLWPRSPPTWDGSWASASASPWPRPCWREPPIFSVTVTLS